MIVNDLETVLAALFAVLQQSATLSFTGTAVANNQTLNAVSDFTGLFQGLPVFGPGVPRGAVISALDANSGTITLDQPLTENCTGQQFTTGFLDTGRRVKFWQQVAEQPAMYMRHTFDEDLWDGEGLHKTIINGEIWIYSKAGEDPDAAPDIALNRLCQAIRNAFLPDNQDTGEFTLNGLVYWARISGRSENDPGDVDKQSKAAIPFQICCP